MAVRDILKGKAAVLAGGYGKQRVFFGKFLGIRPEQAHHCAGQLHILSNLCALAIFHTVNAPTEQVVGNSLALIDKNLYQRRLLARILKDYRIFGIGKHIGAVCGALLHIIAAKRKVRGKASVIAARLICGNGDHFQKPACRDHAAICRRQVSGSIQAKGNMFVFLAKTNAKEFICFQSFEQGNIDLLALVIKTDSSLCNIHGLTRIGKLRIFRRGVYDHASRRLPFFQAIAAQVQKPALCRSVIPGGKGFHNRIFCRTQRTVAGINILVGNHIIDRAGQPHDFIHRLIQTFVLLDGSEYLTGLSDGELSLLRHVILCHRDNGLASINGKRHRLTGKDITVRRCHLIKLIIPGMQRFRQHEPAFVRNIEGIKGLRVRVVNFLGDKFAGRQILDLEPGAGHRNNVPGLGIAFLYFEPCGNGAVIQDIAVGLAVCGNKYRKIRDKRLSFLAGCLVDRIMTVREHFGGSKAVAVRGEQVALAFLCRVIAACRLQVDFKDSAGLRALDHTLIRFPRIFIFGHIRVQIVRMLYKLDIAIDHGFRDIVLRSVQFHLVQRRGSTHLIDRIIQKVAGAGINFPYRPAIATDIVAGHKAAVRPGGIGIYQLAATINPIGRPGKGSVALGGSGVSVALYHMHPEFLQDIAEMDGRSLAALNGDVLRRRGHISVHWQLFHQIGTRQQFFLDLSVFSGDDSFVYFISQNIRAGNMEGDAGHNAVLAGLDDFSSAVSFRFDLYKEGNRITGAGHHGLIARPAPDQHVIGNRNIFSKLKRNRVHHHTLTGEGVFVPASCDRYTTAFQHFQVNLQVIGVRNRQGINLLFCVPFQFQLRRFAFFSGGEGGNRGMGSNLRENPVVGFLCRAPSDYIVKLICRCLPISVAAVRVGTELLLVLPQNNLSRHFIVICVNSGNRQSCAGFPTVNCCQGNSASGSRRKQLQISAVFSAFGSIAIIRSLIGNPTLHAVDRMGYTVRICHHIVLVSMAAGTG